MNIKTIRKNCKKKLEQDLHDMYYSLIGSIIVSAGILEGRSENDSLELFRKLRKDGNFKPENVLDAVKKVQTVSTTVDHLCLVYDEQNRYTPLVAPVFSNIDEETVVVPILPEGYRHGILSHLGEEYIIVEKLGD